MIRLAFDGDRNRELNILCLGCHSDDIEIGCGGTVLTFLDRYPNSTVHWVVFSALGVRLEEARRSAELFVPSSRMRGPILHGFQDGFMPFAGAQIKSLFEELKLQVRPDLILTQNSRDAHQDHRLIADLTWNTFRDHLILEYEIPKYDGDMGRPSVFVPLERPVCDAKVRYLMEAFESQQSKRWFSEDTFMSLMRLRGMECNSPSGYAEAFYARKVVL